MTEKKMNEDDGSIKVWIWFGELKGYVPGVALEVVKEGKYKGMIKCLIRGKIKYFPSIQMKRRKI